MSPSLVGLLGLLGLRPCGLPSDRLRLVRQPLTAGTLFLSAAACGSSHSAAVQPSDDGGTETDGGTEADGGTEGSTGSLRTLTTRALLPTPVDNLLLDPFVTSDTSWGHFLAVIPAVDPTMTSADCNRLTRELLSASPIGIAGPVVLVNPTVLPATSGCTSILAPFVGSSEPVSAELWVSLGDSQGNPLPLPTSDAGTPTLDAYVEVAILSDALPSSTQPTTSVPLTPSTTPPMVVGGRTWALLALAEPTPVSQGGFFSITLRNAAGSIYLAAPQVVPSGSTGAVRRAVGPFVARPTTDVEDGAVRAYARSVRTHRAPARHLGPQHIGSR